MVDSQLTQDSVDESNIKSHTTIRLTTTTHDRLKRIKPDVMTYDDFVDELLHEFESVNLTIEFEAGDT